MSSNVGLTTPRGSGTSGYVQRNLSHLKPRQHPYANASGPNSASGANSSSYGPDDGYKQRQPDPEILSHERKRALEVQVFALRDQLEEEGKLEEDEVDEACEALRRKLVAADEAKGSERGATRNGGQGGKRDLKSYQVHELAEAKIKETEKLRNALGISKTYEEGSHWKRQEERVREKAAGEIGRDRD